MGHFYFLVWTYLLKCNGICILRPVVIFFLVSGQICDNYDFVWYEMCCFWHIELRGLKRGETGCDDVMGMSSRFKKVPLRIPQGYLIHFQNLKMRGDRSDDSAQFGSLSNKC